MATKPTQPALYEKMRARNVPKSPVSPKVDILPQSDAAPSPAKWLAPGTAIRLPIGYILLASGAVLLLILLVYVVGVRQGRNIERAGIDQQIINSTPAGVSDPLSDLQPVVNPSQNRPAAGSPTAANRSTASQPSNWVPVMPKVDPRRRGLNYHVLIETTESGAVQVAEFCRARGLETCVVSGKNERLRRVVAFPGFDLTVTSRTGPDVQSQLQRILQIGEEWARSGSGRKNFGGTYLLRYDG